MKKPRGSTIQWSLLLLTATLVLPAPALAEDEPLPNRFWLEIGGYFLHTLDTRAELNRVVGPIEVGGVVDFNKQLGLSDSEAVPRLDGFYRFGKRSSIDFSFWSIKRSATTFLGTGIDFGEISIPVGEEVSSFYDQTTLRFSYRYSMFNSEKAEIAVSGGLHITGVDLGITCLSCQTVAQEQADLPIPLPVFGFNFRYNISKRWMFGGHTQLFLVEYKGFDGSLTDTRVEFTHHTFKNVGFGFGWNRIHLDLELDVTEYDGALETKTEGFQAFVVVALWRTKYESD